MYGTWYGFAEALADSIIILPLQSDHGSIIDARGINEDHVGWFYHDWSKRQCQKTSMQSKTDSRCFSPNKTTTMTRKMIMSPDQLNWYDICKRASDNSRILAIIAVLVRLRPSDAILRQKSGSTLAKVMAWCLTAPSHYLNQYWLIISKVLWHSSVGNFIRDTSATIH